MSRSGSSRGFQSGPFPGPWHHPCWNGYRGIIGRLALSTPPRPARLNALLPPGAVSGGGAPLRFVPATALPASDYERRIFETGEVSTREDNWHDLFNALVWCRLPRLKAALNAVHCRNLDRQADGRRGPRRDALTLLDESGALLVSRSPALLRALAERDWQRAFVDLGQAWSADTRIVICGHALLEKFRAPWKSITAHALLLRVEEAPLPVGERFIARLDSVLGDRLRARGMCDTPVDLSPVPLTGLPGWWPMGSQDREFYADRSVFRTPPPGLQPAPVHWLDLR